MNAQIKEFFSEGRVKRYVVYTNVLFTKVRGGSDVIVSNKKKWNIQEQSHGACILSFLLLDPRIIYIPSVIFESRCVLSVFSKFRNYLSYKIIPLPIRKKPDPDANDI